MQRPVPGVFLIGTYASGNERGAILIDNVPNKKHIHSPRSTVSMYIMGPDPTAVGHVEGGGVVGVLQGLAHLRLKTQTDEVVLKT